MLTQSEQPLITEGPGLCARILSQSPQEYVLAPDTPDAIPGNAQYALQCRVAPHAHPLPVRIAWPQHQPDPAPAGFDYPGNENFASVIPQILFLRREGKPWQQLAPTESTPDGARLLLPPSDQTCHLSVGIPFTIDQLNDLVEQGASVPSFQQYALKATTAGRSIPAFLVSPARGQSCRGLFLLQAYQHHTEWAGAHALAALLRLFADQPEAAGPFTWAIIPCLNVDALHGGWREDRLHSCDQSPLGGNFNRDWQTFHFPETRAARDFFLNCARHSDLLHGLDLHMGWSNHRNSGGGLTVFDPDSIPAPTIATERAFAQTFFDHVPIEPFPWVRSSPDRPNFAGWMWRRFQCIGQTVEISRFRAFTPKGQPTAVSQTYYESLGPAMARALNEFYANR